MDLQLKYAYHELLKTSLQQKQFVNKEEIIRYWKKGTLVKKKGDAMPMSFMFKNYA